MLGFEKEKTISCKTQSKASYNGELKILTFCIKLKFIYDK